MWHVSSRSGVATLRTAIHLLLTYLLTPLLRRHRMPFAGMTLKRLVTGLLVQLMKLLN